AYRPPATRSWLTNWVCPFSHYATHSYASFRTCRQPIWGHPSGAPGTPVRGSVGQSPRRRLYAHVARVQMEPEQVLAQPDRALPSTAFVDGSGSAASSPDYRSARLTCVRTRKSSIAMFSPAARPATTAPRESSHFEPQVC